MRHGQKPNWSATAQNKSPIQKDIYEMNIKHGVFTVMWGQVITTSLSNNAYKELTCTSYL